MIGVLDGIQKSTKGLEGGREGTYVYKRNVWDTQRKVFCAVF